MRIKFKYKVGLLLLFLFAFLAVPASAVLEVTFDESLPINRIQYYWSSGANSAASQGRIINPSPAITFDLADPNKQAKPASGPPSTKYVFGADESYPASKTTRVRVWNAQAQNDNAKYTALKTFTNPAGTGAFEGFNISYAFIKAKPTTATITQYTESGTVVINPPSTSKTITFVSTSGKVDNMTVEIAQSKWELTQGATKKEITTGGKSLPLDTDSPPTGITLGQGESVTLRVKHINLWGQESDSWSAPYTYTIGAGGVGGAGPDTVTYNLKKLTDGLGVNVFPIAYSSVTAPGITNVKELVEAINDKAGGDPVVTAIGWWDADTMTPGGYIVEIDMNNKQITGYLPSQGLPADPADVPLVKDKVYQVSVLQSVDLELTGIR